MPRYRTRKCGVIDGEGYVCRHNADTCPAHSGGSERCGETTKAGEPCRASRLTCTWHAPRCGVLDDEGNPCPFFPHVCPHHGEAAPRPVKVCAREQCDCTFTGRWRYCSRLCGWKAKEEAKGVVFYEGSRGQIMGGRPWMDYTLR